LWVFGRVYTVLVEDEPHLLSKQLLKCLSSLIQQLDTAEMRQLTAEMLIAGSFNLCSLSLLLYSMKARTREEEDEEEEREADEIELNLGLSLGGRFGVDKSSGSGSGSKLALYSSIAAFKESDLAFGSDNYQ
ncbi:hypothetical protein LINPERPRIM_LOCUS25499, partial [Linum perenne]